MKIKLRTKERTIKMRGESASLSPKQRRRKAMVLRAVREKTAQAAPSKQPEQPSIEASAVEQVQQIGEFTARKAAYIAHEKRKLQKQARRSKATKTEHTDNGTSNNTAQPTVENYRPIQTAETAEGKSSAVSRIEAAIPKVAHTETGATISSIMPASSSVMPWGIGEYWGMGINYLGYEEKWTVNYVLLFMICTPNTGHPVLGV